jgi:hypothetical protein
MKNAVMILLVLFVGCASQGKIENGMYINDKCPYTFRIPSSWHQIYSYPDWVNVDGFAVDGIILRLKNERSTGVIIAVHTDDERSVQTAAKDTVHSIYKSEKEIKKETLDSGLVTDYVFEINTDGLLNLTKGEISPTLILTRKLKYIGGKNFKESVYEVNRFFYLSCSEDNSCAVVFVLFSLPESMEENSAILGTILPTQ